MEKFLENTIGVQISTQPYLKRMPLSGDNFSTYVKAYFRCVIYILLRTFFIYVSKTTGYGCMAKMGVEPISFVSEYSSPARQIQKVHRLLSMLLTMKYWYEAREP